MRRYCSPWKRLGLGLAQNYRYLAVLVAEQVAPVRWCFLNCTCDITHVLGCLGVDKYTQSDHAIVDICTRRNEQTAAVL